MAKEDKGLRTFTVKVRRGNAPKNSKPRKGGIAIYPEQVSGIVTHDQRPEGFAYLDGDSVIIERTNGKKVKLTLQ